MNRNDLLDLINQFKWDVDEDVENNLADLLAMVNYNNSNINVIIIRPNIQTIWLETYDYDSSFGESHEFKFDSILYGDILSKLRLPEQVEIGDIRLSNKNLLKLSVNNINEYVMIPSDIYKEGIQYMIEKMVTSFMDKWSLFNRFMTKDEAIEEFRILNNRFDFIDTIGYRDYGELKLASSKYEEILITYKTNMCNEDFSVTLEK